MTDPDVPRAKPFYEDVYAVVCLIPPGKVATYGQIAAIVGSPRAARAVGYALSNLRFTPREDVPWHRVINAQGSISGRGDVARAERQRHLLEKEGLTFDGNGCVDLTECRWEGPRARLVLPPLGA